MTNRSPQPIVHPRPMHPPFGRIVCVVDTDEESQHGVTQALALAGSDAKVVFVAARPGAAGRVEHALWRAHEAGVTADRDAAPPAAPETALARLAAAHDLFVVGAHTHTRTAGILLGELATALVHRSPLPVLVARERPIEKGIIAASRALPADRIALTTGARIAVRLGAELTVVHVQERDDGDRRAEMQAELANARALLGRELDVYKPVGPVVGSIIGAAEGDGAGLVVVGSRGRSGVPALTSVSERLAHQAPCSVLIMRGW